MRNMFRGILMVILVTLVQACATARVGVIREAPATPPKFSRVAVVPFGNEAGSELPATASENVAGAIIAKIQQERSNPFTEVTSKPSGAPDELVVRGKIVKYNPGSKAARFILIGLGAGSLELEVTLQDGATEELLEQFSTSGEIMAGGVKGASMGIDDMINSAAKKIAQRIARYGAGR
jgi:Domain of unknown function (DUF4410)